jgi:putative iron-regulated protein
MRTIIALTATTALAALAAPAVAQTQADAVLATYADIAAAGYGDSLGAAVTLDAAIDAFRAAPSAEGLARARAARLAARVPYQQTEAFRSRNPIVDDWEGRVNAGPLDEGLIDYVVAAGTAPLDGYDENPSAAINVIANASFPLSCEPVDAAAITPAQLQDRPHEAGGPEANVATGYHAIEFLLWGQDIGPYDATAGQRPWTDYAAGDACTGGNCDRRGAYLAAASELLVADLDEMAAAWARGSAARASVAGDANGVARILTGLGSLSCGELAGERMQLGLLLNDPEEEHSCFADNTHNDHFHDALGIRNVLTGRYVGLDGTITQGALGAGSGGPAGRGRRRWPARRGRRHDGPDGRAHARGRGGQGLRHDARPGERGGRRPDPGGGRRAGGPDLRDRARGRGAGRGGRDRGLGQPRRPRCRLRVGRCAAIPARPGRSGAPARPAPP